MSWLSPASWAKWTWTAVRGAEEGQDDDEDDEEEARGTGGSLRDMDGDEDRSQGFSSDSESQFETPETESPVHCVLTDPADDQQGALTTADKDHEEDEQLIIEGSVGAQGVLQNPTMVQIKNLLAPMKNPLDQNAPVTSLPATQAAVCQPPAVTSHPATQAAVCQHPAVTSHPATQAPVCQHPAVTSHPATQAAGCQHPEEDRDQALIAPISTETDFQEEDLMTQSSSESLGSGHPRQTSFTQPTKPTKQPTKPTTQPTKPTTQPTKPTTQPTKPEPRTKEDRNEVPNEVDDHDKRIPEVNKLDQLDDSFNPLTSGESEVQHSPPSCLASSQSRLERPLSPLPTSEDSVVPRTDMEDKPCSKVVLKPVTSENGFDSGGDSKPLPKRLGKKPLSKLPSKKQTSQTLKPTSEPITAQVSELPIPQNLDDIPIQKSSYNYDPSQWDDPNFNPFGGNSKVNSSPVLPKGSYSFDPESFDESIDPFKPSKTLDNEVSSKAAHSQDRTMIPPEDIKALPKKRKDKIITKFRNTKKHEKPPLVLDICSQDVVVSRVPDLSHHVPYATDEEKLASSDVITQQAEPKEKRPGSEGSNRARAGILEEVVLSYSKPWIQDSLEEDTCCLNKEPSARRASEGAGNKDPNTGSVSLDKRRVSLDKGSVSLDTGSVSLDTGSVSLDKGSLSLDKGSVSLDTGSLSLDKGSLSLDTGSDMDKAAELSQIREEIIVKEIEANQWKTKYEESRMEVMEMRKIVAEYEKTIALMIEGDQHKTMDTHKSAQQLALERDQALADLNSVERSLSDLFRRYENMKKVLEGFKQNEEVLKKCAQEYLVRVKQEEQRYHTLKIHAEEKLDQANADIAQVRSKASSESTALKASLRKEQMKAESLDRALNQKNQEIEELMKICDELIAKLGTSD